MYRKLALLFILMAFSGCLNRGGSGSSDTGGSDPRDDVSGVEMLQSNLEMLLSDVEMLQNEHLRLHHHWKDLPNSVFPFDVPTDAKIEKWKALFEKKNHEIDSVWINVFRYYQGEDHFVAVYDFVETWFRKDSDPPEKHDDRTMWRLLQYDPIPAKEPREGFDRISHIKEVCDNLVSFDYAGTFDYTFRTGLQSTLGEFYLRTVRHDLRQMLGSSFLPALSSEEAAFSKYHDAASEAYEKIQGFVDSYGSLSVAGSIQFEDEDMQKEVSAMEDLLHALYDEGFVPGKGGRVVTRKDIEDEYTKFERTLKDAEYLFPLAERKALLGSERRLFLSWMDTREVFSSQLSGNAKEVYDKGTELILRRKLIHLKNRYNIDDGSLSESFRELLLPLDCSDEELFSHDFEKLYDAI